MVTEDHEAAHDSRGPKPLSMLYPNPGMADPPTADRILLEGMQVPAALGVSKAERNMRRPVSIDLELHLPLRRSGKSDRLADTVDYGEIYRVVEDVAGGRDHRLVEALAERVVEALFAKFPFEACTVRVRKNAPVAGSVQYAGVRITRSRASHGG
jgi:dihydroneopterin aldolase